MELDISPTPSALSTPSDRDSVLDEGEFGFEVK
jgi:hypothetical protein